MMGHDTVSKPLGLVLIVTVHMVFNEPVPAEVSGVLGTNVTFQFTFNVNVTKMFGVYTRNQTKIVDDQKGREGDFDIRPENNSVICHITNLKRHHSGIYWASLMDSGLAIDSNNKVQLVVREANRTGTVPPTATNITVSGSPRVFSTHVVTVLVVSPVVLLAAALTLLIWCLVRSKDKQPPHQHQQQQRSSIPTVQETVEASNTVPAPPLVYSILNFPKRCSAVLEINPNDTEYAAVSYLPEKRHV